MNQVPAQSEARDASPQAGAAERRYAVWRLALWSLFILAFVWTGAINFNFAPQSMMLADQGADNSTNAKLALDLRYQNGIHAINERIRSLPRGSNVAVVCDNNIRQSSAQIISLAIWSDGRRAIQIERMDREVLTEMEKTGADAAFVLDKEQSWFPPETKRLGEMLYFIRPTSVHE